MSDKVLFETIPAANGGAIGVVTLNSPATANAMDTDLGQALGDALHRAETNAEVRAVILRANGKHFCAGANLRAVRAEIAATGDAPHAVLQRFLASFSGPARQIHAMPKPVISVVNGMAAGGGMSLALAADMTLATNTAKFDPVYNRLGLAPLGGMSIVLTELLGRKRAMEFVMRATAVSAETALGMGLINGVHPADRCEQEAMHLAQIVAERSPTAIAHTKELINRDHAQFAARLDRELDAFKECSATPEHQALIAKLIEKHG